MENPLPKDDVQAIMDELTSRMIRRGYERRDGTWYPNPELPRIFDFQAGGFRKKAYLNLGLMVRALDNSSRPRVCEGRDNLNRESRFGSNGWNSDGT